VQPAVSRAAAVKITTGQISPLLLNAVITFVSCIVARPTLACGVPISL
jgi:hypothetical protein